MRLSRYFLPTLKENPKEAAIVSHRLMLRSGMIRQVASGIYSWLPMGTKVLQKISDIIREEHNKVGCNEIIMPTIQPADLWVESGRYEDYGKEMLRMKDRHNKDMLYGPTHEEVTTDIFRNCVKSYKDLPVHLYQIQWKFRDEIRPRFGVLRGREFLMKDNYSFDINKEAAIKSYNLIYKTYLKIFKRMGLTAIPVKADTGPIGGDLSHEFHIIANTGESEVFYDKEFDQISLDGEIDIEKIKSLYSAADEMHKADECPIPQENVKSKRGIEVGHIFYFGDKYSKPLGAEVTDQNGKLVAAEMCSYGIGVSRVIGAIIEASHDEKGIIWPESVAPFKASLLNLKINDEVCTKQCEEFYQKCLSQNLDILYDDTDNSAGAKFANHDLIGNPYIISVGPRTAKEGKFEFKIRKTGETELLDAEKIMDKLIK